MECQGSIGVLSSFRLHADLQARGADVVERQLVGGGSRPRADGNIRRKRRNGMTGGKAHGPNRQYKVECRDVLHLENPELTRGLLTGLTCRSNP